MPRRRKNGSIVVTSTPQTRAQGRRAERAAAVRSAVDPRDPAVRLIEARASLAWLRADHSRTTTPMGATASALTAKSKRASASLGATPEGREERARIAKALAFGGGAPLRFVERARVDFAAYALAAAVLFVTLMREHGLDSTAALARAWSHARWQSLADALLDRLGAADLAGPIAALPALADLFRLAERATTSARQELFGALELQREARDARAAQPRALHVFALPTTTQPSEPEAPPSHDDRSGPPIPDAVDAEPVATNNPLAGANQNPTARVDPTSACVSGGRTWSQRRSDEVEATRRASVPVPMVQVEALGPGWHRIDAPPLTALRALRRFRGLPADVPPQWVAALADADAADAQRKGNPTTNGETP